MERWSSKVKRQSGTSAGIRAEVQSFTKSTDAAVSESGKTWQVALVR